MIATGVLAAVGSLVITVLLGFLISVIFRSRSATKRLQLGISATVIGPWLVGLYVVLVLVLWKFLGKTG